MLFVATESEYITAKERCERAGLEPPGPGYRRKDSNLRLGWYINRRQQNNYCARCETEFRLVASGARWATHSGWASANMVE